MDEVRQGSVFRPDVGCSQARLIHLEQTLDDCDFERVREITELPYDVMLETIVDTRSIRRTA